MQKTVITREDSKHPLLRITSLLIKKRDRRGFANEIMIS